MREWHWVWVCQAKRVSLGAMNSAVCITLSRVGINTKFDRRWTENLKIAENCGREICMGAYMSEGCQKSVSSPKTLETIKKVRGGVRPRDSCGNSPERYRLSYEGGWQILGTNTDYRKLVITDRNWDRWRLSRPSTIAVECYRIMIWSVQVPRTETAYRCLHERGDKGWYWTSLEGPWSTKTKGCNEISQKLHGTGTTPYFPV